jgi:hypothetical protein
MTIASASLVSGKTKCSMVEAEEVHAHINQSLHSTPKTMTRHHHNKLSSYYWTLDVCDYPAGSDNYIR